MVRVLLPRFCDAVLSWIFQQREFFFLFTIWWWQRYYWWRRCLSTVSIVRIQFLFFTIVAPTTTAATARQTVLRMS